MNTSTKAALLALGIIAAGIGLMVAQVVWIVRHLERLP